MVQAQPRAGRAATGNVMSLLSSMTSLQARERWLATGSVWVGMMLFTMDAV